MFAQTSWTCISSLKKQEEIWVELICKEQTKNKRHWIVVNNNNNNTVQMTGRRNQAKLTMRKWLDNWQ